ncbi:helix-turn-helix domain-containing protein [Pseudactinotalea terrae]|uniref:helix-turn-helix domain-containing protein n=1 Tax=Pseudactinotalea terrae TaxID=1743262 RepID=UPI0012E270A4|nr:helix-turn-helix domain-containing protein [Pseudactinotalea terrae]
MSALSVAEAAERLGVSRARVHHMIDAGDLDVQRVGRQWAIDPASLPRSRVPAGRPMSQRIAWALLLADAEHGDPWLGSDEAYRLRRRVAQWRASGAPLDRLRSWLASRAPVMYLAAQDAEAVGHDHRFVASGVSDPRSGISAATMAEGYVHQDEAPGLIADHLLVPAPRARANVVLRLSPLALPNPVPDLVVIADLADHDGAREHEKARDMLWQWQHDRPQPPQEGRQR